MPRDEPGRGRGSAYLLEQSTQRRTAGRAVVTALAKRVTWGFLDQVLSSGSNFALSGFVAATVSARGFGAFAIAYAAWGFFGGFSGGLVSIPLVVRFSGADIASSREASRSST